MKMYRHNKNVSDPSTKPETLFLKPALSVRQSERMKQIGEPLKEISLQFGRSEEWPPIRRESVNLLNKQPRTADKGWSVQLWGWVRC